MKKKCCLFVVIILVFYTSFLFVSCDNYQIKMYDIYSEKVLSLPLEDYVAGVTAAEIDESFAQSAIEAQSVLARTFVLWFLKNKKSKYNDANISNDTTEAQAYTNQISDKIKNACKNTKGKFLTYNDQIILPYYCSNAGGKTSLPIDVFGSDLPYYKSVNSEENDGNSKNFYWSAQIEKSTILFAMQKLNKNLASVNTFSVGQKDSCGRAKTFVVGGIEVNANDLRLAIGNTILKSCLISKIIVENTCVLIEGTGYGHGVGLSQYGANILAEKNYDYNNILLYFFEKCKIANI